MTDDDYRVVNFQGEVVFDSAIERAEQERHRAERDGEPFTATSDCPWCGHVAVHWLSPPRLKPDWDTHPIGKAMRLLDASLDNCNEQTLSFRPPVKRYDQDGTVVARVCVKCGYRWGQR